jgi:hypothetical protein
MGGLHNIKEMARKSGVKLELGEIDVPLTVLQFGCVY